MVHQAVQATQVLMYNLQNGETEFIIKRQLVSSSIILFTFISFQFSVEAFIFIAALNLSLHSRNITYLLIKTTLSLQAGYRFSCSGTGSLVILEDLFLNCHSFTFTTTTSMS